MGLFDADDLAEYHCDLSYDKGYEAGYAAAKAEQPHGRWISTTSTLTGYWHKCSECGGVAIPYYNGQDILSPYCPWCGARMDLTE